MKKILRQLCLSLLALLTFVPSQAQKGKTSQELRSPALEDLKKGVTAPSYLFGTMHIICADDYLWTKTMQERFEQTKALYLELNMGDPNLMSSAALRMMDFSGTILRDYFKSEADYNTVLHYIQDTLHQDMTMLDHMKPIALYMMYTSGAINNSCKETVSYEMKLLDQAKTKQQSVNGLETLDDQLSLLENIPTDTIIAHMVRIARGEEQDQDDMNRLVSAYKKQDLQQLNKLITESGEPGIDNKEFIDKRNASWIPVIDKAMQAQPSFFAVGAGHVPGLIQLLRAQGFVVEAVQ